MNIMNFTRSSARHLLAVMALALICSAASAGDISILRYGARGDGHTVNTQAIQQAVDSCAAAGGGRVIVPAGVFVSGTIHLKSHVNLVLEEGAVLKGSDDIGDYQEVHRTPALIIAENLEQVSLSGHGTLDGNGGAAAFQKGDNGRGRPMLVFFVGCREVRVQDIHLRAPAFWTQKYSGCDGVLVTGVSVYAHANWNNDGIDIDSRNVVVTNCRFDTDDDAICLKSEREEPCENVTISNCVAASNCNAIKMGTASTAGFRNINISNIAIHAASEDNIRHWKRTLTGIAADRTVISGIAIEDVDGGQSRQINVSHITMRSVQTPIFIRLGDRRQPAGSLKQIIISDVIATSASRMCNIIAGIPGVPVQGVSIHDLRMVSRAAAPAAPPLDSIPENTRGYPENRMFGQTLPAAGFFIRHAQDVDLRDIVIETPPGETRPFLAADDVQQLSLSRCGFSPASQGPFALGYLLRNVRQGLFFPRVFGPAYGKLMHIEGASSADIRLYAGNQVAGQVSFGAGVDGGQVLRVLAPGP